MEILKRIFLILAIAGFSACNHDLDILGFFSTSSPKVNKRFEQSQKYNCENGFPFIVTSDTSYQVVFASDCHVGEGKYLSKILSHADSAAIPALFLLGDLTSGREDDYRTFRDLIGTRYHQNVFTTVGNHDLYFKGWNFYKDFFCTSIYYLVVQSATAKDIFIILDSGSGTIGRKQFEWLENLLDNQRNLYRYCFIGTHVNMFRNGGSLTGSNEAEEIEVLLSLFRKHQVNYVISGHDHNFYEEIFMNTTYITMAPADDREPIAEYLTFTIGQEISYRRDSIYP